MYKVIGYYHPGPGIWKCWKIGMHLTELTKSCGFRPLDAEDTRYEKAPWSDTSLHAHVRRRTLRSPEGAQWHKDGDYGHVPMDHGIILWSNTHPTQFRYGERIVQPKPYEIVYVRNLDCYHRRPLVTPRNRYIFRQRVE